MQGHFSLTNFTIRICVPYEQEDEVNAMDDSAVSDIIDEVEHKLKTLNLDLPEGWKVEVQG